MKLNEYQSATAQTAVYPDAGKFSERGLAYLFMKLNGEAGEGAEKYAKILRDQDGIVTEANAEEIAKELGDVMWYVARLADEFGYTLEDVAQKNIAKLFSRKERGVLGGSGDNR